MTNKLNNPERNLNVLVSEAKNILTQTGDLNIHKENLSQIISQVDFLLEKYDNIYEKFIDIFIAMGQFDFSKRLAYCEDSDNFINFIVNGINILNEEFEEKAIAKKVFYDFIGTCALNDSLTIITHPDGFIYFAHSGKTRLSNFNDTSLFNQSIHALFRDFRMIEELIQNEGSIKNIKADLRWQGETIPASVDLTISNTFGKIESLIYIIRI